MLMLTPIILVLVSVYLYVNDMGNGLEIFLALYAIDTVSDIYFMNGFYKKSNDSLEFLQSSPRFQKMIREITIVDIVRRIVVYQIPYFVILVCSIGNSEAMEWCKVMSALPWIEVLVAQLVVVVARHFVVWNHVYACTSIGAVIMMVIMIFNLLAVDMGSGTPEIGANVVLIVCVLLTSIGTVCYTDKKIRESYYD